MAEIEFLVNSEVIPTNKSSKYDGVITAIKGLEIGQHVQMSTTTDDEAVDLSNAVRSAAKGRKIRLNIIRRSNILYIKEKKS